MTEEDKEFINYYISQYLSEDIAIEDDFKFVDAIKRVVARLKDLEAIDQVHKEQNGELQIEVAKLKEKVTSEYARGFAEGLLDDSIPKSKVKAKIEELKGKIEYYKKYANTTEGRVERRLMCDQIEELKTAIKYLEELLQE